jgi:putative transcriptional regulator
VFASGAQCVVSDWLATGTDRQGLDNVTLHAYGPGGGAQPIDTLLAAYAAGTLDRPLHALVASHLALSARNRAFVSTLESARAADLVQGEGLALSNRDAMLAAILAQDPVPVAVVAPVMADALFPAPLARYLNVDPIRVPWRFKLPGVKEYRVEHHDGGEVSMLWIRAGRKMPQHSHEGQEITLLLKGGFTDSLGHYRRGDIAIADAELDHKPVADADEDCICFAVTDAPLTLTGPFARWMRTLLGRH